MRLLFVKRENMYLIPVKVIAQIRADHETVMNVMLFSISDLSQIHAL